MKALGEFGIAADAADVAKLIGSDGRRLARVVADAAHAPIDSAKASAIDHRAGEIYNQLNVNPRPLGGSTELLAELDARHIPWAIATSSLQAQVRASVEALKLSRRPMIVDGSHVERAKPAPDLLLRGAQELGVRTQSTWYVGDSIWDMQAAQSAGMPAIGVTSGFATREELQENGAWLVIARLTELEQMIDGAGPKPD